MKKTYIVAAIMVVAAIVLLINVAGESSAYSNFEDAARNGGKVKIAGQLAKDREMHYNPEKDPNYFTFYLTDSKGEQRKVVLLREKPQDFEMSEQLVLTGRMKDGEFVATDMLMKCPSKYKDEEIYIKSEKENS
ncbi:MAG: cytochrome c maturation protein CcmE [Saprospiraceae bacterium]|nr:cytochrome c maturation protein CcmE [Saprospiraceae bacterium]